MVHVHIENLGWTALLRAFLALKGGWRVHLVENIVQLGCVLHRRDCRDYLPQLYINLVLCDD